MCDYMIKYFFKCRKSEIFYHLLHTISNVLQKNRGVSLNIVYSS
ncbi:hypothetical protein LX69_02082 [Breznakibacter xylanolyticus]|uniref:Uncharacterized protein n=1 Tax=Breznakibacter xylanolyticus TaxID=990 RepID=A0A2W7N752_9BACT|nr:hypothetical protein LX69_02082 [Breznakibacter xylanolyticus]